MSQHEHSDDPESREIREQLLIQSLLACPSISAAADESAVPRRTVYRWLAKPEFQEKLRQAQRKHFAAAGARLTRLCDTAITAIEDALKPTEETKDRLKAADLVLSKAIHLLEVQDLDDRVRRIEELSEAEMEREEQRA